MNIFSRVVQSIRERRELPHCQLSFSQEGEDMILRRMLEQRIHRPGFYVDVGAHHPFRFSNTYFFYRHGWRGINVEPNPEIYPEFQRHRRRDINLCCGVAEAAGTMKYRMFNEPALNTFSSDFSKKIIAENKGYQIVREVEIPIFRLDQILASHLPSGTDIDFLSVDVEGYDLQVLASNDWTKFRPAIVLAEEHAFNLEAPEHSPLHIFLTQQGYRLFAKTFYTLLYVSEHKTRAAH